MHTRFWGKKNRKKVNTYKMFFHKTHDNYESLFPEN